MLDIDFETIEEGIEKLKKAVELRNQMGGALFFNVCEEDCLKLANELAEAGADRGTMWSILTS